MNRKKSSEPTSIPVSDLKVSCDGTASASGSLGHPKVYFTLSPSSGTGACPYCNQSYHHRKSR